MNSAASPGVLGKRKRVCKGKQGVQYPFRLREVALRALIDFFHKKSKRVITKFTKFMIPSMPFDGLLDFMQFTLHVRRISYG